MTVAAAVANVGNEKSCRLRQHLLDSARARALVKLADVKATMKSRRAQRRHLATKPEPGRLPVKGQSAPRVTSSVRRLFDRFLIDVDRKYRRYTTVARCIYDVCHPRVIIPLVRSGNRYHNGLALLWPATCETTTRGDTSSFAHRRERTKAIRAFLLIKF